MSTLATDRTTIPVSIYHGSGSDFALVDADEPVTARRAFARRVCDRTDGLGVDGVLFLALEPGFTPPRVVMTLVQPDGSTAPMCASAARCAAAWAMARTGTDAVMIDTQAGSRLAERVDDERIAVEMDRPSFDPADVPISTDEPVVGRPLGELGIHIALDVEVSAVNTGDPHAVAFVDDVDVVDRLGPALGHADAFPRGTNVTVASPCTSTDPDQARVTFRQRTCERGVEAESAACGGGAVAIAAVATRLERFGTPREWRLRPPSGDLLVRFDDHGRALLEGPVVHESNAWVPVTEGQ